MAATTQTHSYWPKAIVLYFVVVILSIATFVIWVVRQNNDLVRKDYYAEELRFQSQLDRVNRTRQLNSEAVIAFDKTSRTVRISIPNAAAETRGTIHFYRPSDAALDKTVELSLDGKGGQEIANSLQPGFWKVRVSWSDGSGDFFTENSIVIPEK